MMQLPPIHPHDLECLLVRVKLPDGFFPLTFSPNKGVGGHVWHSLQNKEAARVTLERALGKDWLTHVPPIEHDMYDATQNVSVFQGFNHGATQTTLAPVDLRPAHVDSGSTVFSETKDGVDYLIRYTDERPAMADIQYDLSEDWEPLAPNLFAYFSTNNAHHPKIWTNTNASLNWGPHTQLKGTFERYGQGNLVSHGFKPDLSPQSIASFKREEVDRLTLAALFHNKEQPIAHAFANNQSGYWERAYVSPTEWKWQKITGSDWRDNVIEQILQTEEVPDKQTLVRMITQDNHPEAYSLIQQGQWHPSETGLKQAFGKMRFNEWNQTYFAAHADAKLIQETYKRVMNYHFETQFERERNPFAHLSDFTVFPEKPSDDLLFAIAKINQNEWQHRDQALAAYQKAVAYHQQHQPFGIYETVAS